MPGVSSGKQTTFCSHLSFRTLCKHLLQTHAQLKHTATFHDKGMKPIRLAHRQATKWYRKGATRLPTHCVYTPHR
jgi:hypothetical protein